MSLPQNKYADRTKKKKAKKGTPAGFAEHLRGEARRIEKLKELEDAEQVTLSRPEHKGMLEALLVGDKQNPISAMIEGFLGEPAAEVKINAAGVFPVTKEVSDVESKS